jgi:hypothetical protein
MSRICVLALGAIVSIIPVVSANAAPTKAPFPMDRSGTTNIADCANAAVGFRNECISRSRPVSGKQIYAQLAATKAAELKIATLSAAKVEKMAKVAKVAAASGKVPSGLANVPQGFKVHKDGTTNVADCVKAAPAVRNECISRSRPLSAKELTKFVKQRAAAATLPVALKVLAKLNQAAKPTLPGKGFAIAADGTTNIVDCAKANANFRNECISRSRPVSGRLIYSLGQKSPKATKTASL